MTRLAPDKTSNVRLTTTGIVLVIAMTIPLPEAASLALLVALLGFAGFVSSYSIPKTATLISPAGVLATIIRVPLQWDKARDGFSFADLWWTVPLQCGLIWITAVALVPIGATIRKHRNTDTLA